MADLKKIIISLVQLNHGSLRLVFKYWLPTFTNTLVVTPQNMTVHN